ncbi:hypothetical protein CTA2_7900 [Colletotrichum tanaceti]|uniref:Uncharacterized protein n=1 Tax=Colletotrichum tanaceti TaxID=1306861 RepID=A0A4U6X0K0_9PEZI|nr:hypothetical protein CTA2_7915 [Colletotrichum tanaceti]KAJ0168284.1 hypothetical protein CTA2_7900 [Colletotrichum tanaceti]TKW48902.1 hypothetical protein CTA1_8564 [Colletotrichum tanaceti]
MMLQLHPNDVERDQIANFVFGDAFSDRRDGPASRAYFGHYCSVVCPVEQGDAVIYVGASALRSHADVVRCARILREKPLLPFNDYVEQAMPDKETTTTPNEKMHVARTVVAVTFMINCSLGDHQAFGLERTDPSWAKWEGDVRFASFVSEAFTQHLSMTEEQMGRVVEAIAHKKSLKAWKLAKRYDIKIRPTNNLLEHLAYDAGTKILKVFHQVFFLRAHLAVTKNHPLELGFEESLAMGTLPPRLLLETLLTLHTILYPIIDTSDEKSYASLEKVIRRHAFDKEAMLIDFVRTVPPDMVFRYWGDRLTRLHEAVRRPPPTNTVISWFERHTSERNALTVAIVGLFLAALFGFLSFLVGLLQLVLAWVAWKHPN